MKIQLDKPKTKKVHVGDEAYDCTVASVWDYNQYQKKIMDDPTKSAELMIGFLEKLGMPKELLWKMTFEQLNKLVSYLTLGDVSEGK